MSEFSRLIDLREIGHAPVTLTASPQECAALAARFDLVAVDQLTATVALDLSGRIVTAQGTMKAAFVQSCAISGEDVPVSVAAPIALRFVPVEDTAQPADEIELDADDLDDIAYSGTSFDLGEAIAQDLALAIDPYLEGPNADEFRRQSGLLDQTAASPFAALAALKGKDPPAH